MSRVANPGKFLPWYRHAEMVLGPLVPHKTDDEILSIYLSPDGYLLIPLPTETDRKSVINRDSASISIAMNREIEMNLYCNTLGSIEKMRNILEGVHEEEQEQFVNQLRPLDDSFETSLWKKMYPHYPRQTPEWERVLRYASNKMTNERFQRIFARADEIYEEGRKAQSERGITWNPIRPGIFLASSSFRIDANVFQEKLEQLKPLYEISLRIKTGSEIKKELAGRSTVMAWCPKCGYRIPAIVTRVCQKCGTRMKVG